MFAPLIRALSSDPAALRAEAEKGEPEARYALALVHAYGLHGARPDLALAGRWRQRALAQRTTRAVTQYVPAFNGAPSRVHIINLAAPAVGPAQVAASERCLAFLSGAAGRQGADRPCGDPVQRARISALWAIAKG